MKIFSVHKVGFFFIVSIPIVLLFIPLDWLAGQESLCLYHAITGNFCLGCGITKAVIAMIQFNFVRAWAFNPLVVVVGPLLTWIWLQTAYRLLLGGRQKVFGFLAGLRGQSYTADGQ